MAQYKEYPRMIYHESGATRSVSSREELMEYIGKGWSKTPVSMSEAKELKARIEKAKEELRLMEMRLASIEVLSGSETDLSAVETRPATPPVPEEGRDKKKPGKANKGR